LIARNVGETGKGFADDWRGDRWRGVEDLWKQWSRFFN